jgi:hypothetical protein
MTSYNFDQAKAYFAAKMAFTTGPHELDGIIQRGEDVVIVDVRLPRALVKQIVAGVT